MSPRVAVIVPAFNEEDCIEELSQRLAKLFNEETAYEWEAIIVENGSDDSTWQMLCAIHDRDPRFRILRLSRNFRMDGGLTAGLDYIDADACVLMTADLQDPPELIPEFLRKWEQGYENIYGVVLERQGTGPLRRFNSRSFYWIANRLTGGQIPENASDFRLLDRKVYQAVRGMRERNRFVRGLVAWVGFKSIGVPFERPPRFAGESKAYSLEVFGFAVRGVFAYSYVPLRLISVFGIVLSGLAALGLLGAVFLWITQGVPFGGFGTIVTLILLVLGVLAFMIGVVSEYVGLIYEEVKARPSYLVSETVGFDSGSSAT